MYGVPLDGACNQIAHILLTFKATPFLSVKYIASLTL
jgi:hypothetical protein